MTGIWIPIEILHDDTLTMQEKLILCEIYQLEMLDKGCIASNQHFGEKLKISPKSVSNSISSLSSKGYIKTHIVEGSRNMKREIFTIHNYGNYYPQKMDRLSIKNGESKEKKTINKKDILEEYKNKYPNVGEKILSILEDFIKYRKEIGKPIKTINALIGYGKKLNEISEDGRDIYEAIKNMKENEWQTVY